MRRLLFKNLEARLKKLESDKEQTESCFKAIFDNAMQAFFLFDRQANVVAFNRMAVSDMKKYYDIDLVKNLKLEDLFHEKEEFSNLFQTILEGKQFQSEVCPKTKLESGDWFEVVLVPWYNANNEIIGVVFSTFCIQNRKMVEKRLAKSKYNLKAMFDSSPQIYLLLNKNYKVLTFNRLAAEYFERIFGLHLQNGLLLDIDPKTQSLSYILKKLYDSFQGERIREEFEYTNLHHEHFWFDVSFIPVYETENQLFGVAVSGLDITQKKEAEERLKQSEETLRELNAAKDRFFAILAHDLKSPFTSLLNLSQLLIEESEDMTKDDLKEMHQYMYNASHRTLGLLENLLKWSQAQSGFLKANTKKIDIVKVIQSSIEVCLQSAQQKKIQLISDFKAPLFAFADDNMVLTITRNLIGNAIKFTPLKGEIKVSAKIVEDTIEISIADNGVGIESQEIQNLFHFDSHHSTIGTQGEHGTGLGLILCKDFVELNNGKIWANSLLGKGTTFTFSLPISK